jgi:hypothetical protein
MWQERFLIKGPGIRVQARELETCLKFDLFWPIFPGRKLLVQQKSLDIGLLGITDFELIVFLPDLALSNSGITSSNPSRSTNVCPSFSVLCSGGRDLVTL